MKKAMFQIVTSISLGLLSSSALASYTGHFLIGIDGGYSMQNGTPYFIVNNYPNFLNPAFINSFESSLNDDLDNDGGVIGGFAGYEVTDGFWFAGLEANFSVQDIGKPKDFSGNLSTVTANFPYTVNLDYSRGLTMGVSGRIGMKIHEWFYPYVRLGVEGSKDKIFVTSFVTSLGNVTVYDDRQYNGRLLLGAGGEIPVHPNISLRVEYNYIHNNGTFAHVIASPGTAGNSMNIYHKPNQHTIKGAITWNFV